MPFAIDFNPPIITVSVQGHLSEPSISIKVDLGTAGLPPEVSDALEFGHPHLLPWAWKRAFFAVLGDRYGAGIKVGNGMEGVVAIDTRPFLNLLVDIATQRIEFRLVASDSLKACFVRIEDNRNLFLLAKRNSFGERRIKLNESLCSRIYTFCQCGY
jgi:hypothetical protein